MPRKMIPGTASAQGKPMSTVISACCRADPGVKVTSRFIMPRRSRRNPLPQSNEILGDVPPRPPARRTPAPASSPCPCRTPPHPASSSSIRRSSEPYRFSASSTRSSCSASFHAYAILGGSHAQLDGRLAGLRLVDLRLQLGEVLGVAREALVDECASSVAQDDRPGPGACAGPATRSWQDPRDPCRARTPPCPPTPVLRSRGVRSFARSRACRQWHAPTGTAPRPACPPISWMMSRIIFSGSSARSSRALMFALMISVMRENMVMTVCLFGVVS